MGHLKTFNGLGQVSIIVYPRITEYRIFKYTQNVYEN